MTDPPVPPAAPDVPGPEGNAGRLDVLARLLPPLAHRINNCLAVVEGTLDVLADRPEPVRAETARLEARRIGKLLAGLTVLARDPAASGEPALEAVDLAAVLRNAVELVGPYLERAGVRLDVRTALAGAVVRGSEPRLFQLVVCALVEAAGPLSKRAVRSGTPAAGRHRVCLSTVGDGRRVTVRIASTGALPSALTAGPLARFFAEVAAQHGARPRVRGVGPYACQLGFPPAAVVGAPLSAAPRVASVRLLLLETTPELGGLIPAVLEGAGYRVDVVTTPARALADLTSGHAALLVDGENARAGEPGLRALIAGGLPAPVAWLGAPPDLDLSGHACLPAPFPPRALLAFVAAFVR